MGGGDAGRGSRVSPLFTGCQWRGCSRPATNRPGLFLTPRGYSGATVCRLLPPHSLYRAALNDCRDRFDSRQTWSRRLAGRRDLI